MPRKRAIGVVGAALAVVFLAASAAAAPQRTESPAALYRFLAATPGRARDRRDGLVFGTATVDETTATLRCWISYERLPRRAGSAHIHRVARGHELPPPLPPSDVPVRPHRRSPRAALVVERAADQHRPGKATVDLHGRLLGCTHASRAVRMITARNAPPRLESAPVVGYVGAEQGGTRYRVIRDLRSVAQAWETKMQRERRELDEEAHRQASRLARPRGDTGARRGRGRDDGGRGLGRRTRQSAGHPGATQDGTTVTQPEATNVSAAKEAYWTPERMAALRSQDQPWRPPPRRRRLPATRQPARPGLPAA